MGTTSHPLKILVDIRWKDRPEVQLLRDKGHDVRFWDAERYDGGVDLILSPIAHYWHESFWEEKYLDAAIKAARRKARGTKPKAEAS